MASKRNNKFRVNMFFIFLAMASLLWMLVKLSEQHISRVVFDVEYGKVPDDKLLTGSPPEHLYATVEASGYRLLNYYFSSKRISIDLTNANKKNNYFYIANNEYNKSVIRQLPKNTRVLEMTPDTLFFEFDKRVKKEVPVVSQLSLDFLENFKVDGGVHINPDKILIRGAENEINQIEAVYTEVKSLSSVNENLNIKLNVLYPEGVDGIELDEDIVTITATVKRFSEKVIKIPITVIDLPENFEIKTFPSEVGVVCKAPVDVLKEIHPDQFTILCSYSEMEKEGRNILIPKLVKRPKNLNDVRVIEEKVEFILRRL